MIYLLEATQLKFFESFAEQRYLTFKRSNFRSVLLDRGLMSLKSMVYVSPIVVIRHNYFVD